MRAGVHTGPAVERDGDWFGATVNLAARVSGAASGGEVLVTAATASRVTGDQGSPRLHLSPRGSRELRNVAEPVELLEATCDFTRTLEGMPIDPVCRMAVDPDHAAGTLVHQGVEALLLLARLRPPLRGAAGAVRPAEGSLRARRRRR